jgi:hypothetical protein
MKTKTMACALAILSPLFIASLTPFFGGSAQSGEGAPMPAPTVERRKLPEAELDGAINQNADKYKLIFPTGVEDQFLYIDPPRNRKERKQREKLRKRDAHRRAKAYQDSFLEQLNLAGEQGYRLISTTEEMAIARLDGVQYEYTTFDTTGSWAGDGFLEKLDELSKQGFSLADHVIVYYRCETEDSSGAMLVPYCYERHRIFLERVKGTTTPARYEIAEFIPQISWSRILKGDVILKDDASLTAKVNNLIAAGLFPTHILYGNCILLQPIAYRSSPFSEKPEAQVITGGDKWLRKKVNELAQQGFRLALNHDSTALMYRNRSVTTPVSYVWLYAMEKEKKKKTLEAELAQLGNTGAIYRTSLLENDGKQVNLIFEKPSTPDGERSEYKTLGFQLSDVENAPMKRVETDLTPESKENLKTLNRLVKEGFEVCDIFDLGYTNASNYGVLLERRIAVR